MLAMLEPTRGWLLTTSVLKCFRFLPAPLTFQGLGSGAVAQYTFPRCIVVI